MVLLLDEEITDVVYYMDAVRVCNAQCFAYYARVEYVFDWNSFFKNEECIMIYHDMVLYLYPVHTSQLCRSTGLLHTHHFTCALCMGFAPLSTYNSIS